MPRGRGRGQSSGRGVAGGDRRVGDGAGGAVDGGESKDEPFSIRVSTKRSKYSEAVWRAVEQWRGLGASKELLRDIEQGVAVEFASGPPPPYDRGASCVSLTSRERTWLKEEVTRLLRLGAIEVAPESERTHVSKVFLVEKGNSTPEKPKYRVVVDLRPMNAYCPAGTCRVEGLRELPPMLERGDFLTAVDLTDGYFHLSIRECDRRYMTFHLAGFGYFRYVAMPFGWNLAPGHFCRLLEPVVKSLRSPGWRSGRPGAGARLLWYLDDWLLMARSECESRELTRRFLYLLQRCGLSVNEEKCTLEPTQRIKHLGLVVDSALGTFELDVSKLQRVRREAGQMLNAVQRLGRVPARALAKLLGLCEFATPAVPFMRHHLRSLYDSLPHDDWGGFAALGKPARFDLRWLTRLAAAEATKSIWRPRPTAKLYTDASKFGWGALLDGEEARGFFTLVESAMHINVLETKALTRALQVFGPRMRGLVVQHFIDSTAALGATTKMVSKSPEMMDALRELYAELLRFRWEVHSEWISTQDNVGADGLSRVTDDVDWQLNRCVFAALGGRRRFDTDRFASETNALAERFNSRWACPGTAGVNALLQDDWAHTVSWCNPPWPLLADLAATIRDSGARAAVVAPFWPAAPWRAQLHDLANWVVDLPMRPDLWVAASAGAARTHAPRWRTQVFLIGLPRPVPSLWLGGVHAGGGTRSGQCASAPPGHAMPLTSLDVWDSPAGERCEWWTR